MIHNFGPLNNFPRGTNGLATRLYDHAVRRVRADRKVAVISVKTISNSLTLFALVKGAFFCFRMMGILKTDFAGMQLRIKDGGWKMAFGLPVPILYSMVSFQGQLLRTTIQWSGF